MVEPQMKYQFRKYCFENIQNMCPTYYVITKNQIEQKLSDLNIFQLKMCYNIYCKLLNKFWEKNMTLI